MWLFSSVRSACVRMLCTQVTTFNVASQSDGPRWNMFQWLQYWCTRQHGPDRKLGERKNSITSLDDEADSRDAKRKSVVSVPASPAQGTVLWHVQRQRT
jgi:hypothetical protein